MHARALLSLLLALGLHARAQDGAGRPAASIEPAELASLLEGGAVKVIDVRPAEEYAAGHVPGALHLDRRAFDNPDQARDGKVVAPERLNQLLSERGVGRDDALVVYSGQRSPQMATRLWWLLRGYGHAGAVRVLDGAWEGWVAAGQATQAGPPPAATPSRYEVGPFDATQLADKAAVEGRGPNVVLLDVRDLDEFTGARVSSGAGRGGRIPGAVHLLFRENLTPEGRLKPAEELRERYARLGIGPETEVIVYCMRAHRASHTCFVLKELLGCERVRVYNGSWIEWSNDPDRPVETGR